MKPKAIMSAQYNTSLSAHMAVTKHFHWITTTPNTTNHAIDARPPQRLQIGGRRPRKTTTPQI